MTARAKAQWLRTIAYADATVALCIQAERDDAALTAAAICIALDCPEHGLKAGQ